MQGQLASVSGRGHLLHCQGAKRRQAAVSTRAYSGSSVSPPLKGKHFLHIDDFSTEELRDMLDLGLNAKQKLSNKQDTSFKPFLGYSMCMIFTKPSARTRISFETVGDMCTLNLTSEETCARSISSLFKCEGVSCMPLLKAMLGCMRGTLERRCTVAQPCCRAQFFLNARTNLL
jgi:aspartate carbamoyltransferase catalytic subunit